MALGTTTWIERTGGKLAWHDRLALMAQAVYVRAAARLGSRAQHKIRVLEVDEILPPDSKITRAAMELSQQLCEPFLFNHCIRSYFWARLLNQDGKPFDDEAVFTALMLHDLGLVGLHGADACASEREEYCFTQVGADRAYEMAREFGWDAKRADLTANAITLHLNVSVTDRDSREAKMVRDGSGADVAGLGLRILHRDQIDEVVRRVPRLSLKKQMAATIAAESRIRHESRIAFLCHRLHLDERMRRVTLFSE